MEEFGKNKDKAKSKEDKKTKTSKKLKLTDIIEDNEEDTKYEFEFLKKLI